MSSRLKTWSNQLSDSGSIEAALAAALLILELVGEARSGPTTGVAVAVVLCAGAAVAGRHPKMGTAMTCAALAVGVLWSTGVFGAAFYAPLVTLFACVRRHDVPAGVTTWAVCEALMVVLTVGTHPELGDVLVDGLVWTMLFALPVVLGGGYRRQQGIARRSLELELERQRREIAAELHDTLAYELSLISALAHKRMLENADTDPDGGLDEISRAARRGGAQLRSLMTLLRVGAAPALLSLADMLADSRAALERAGFPVEVSVIGVIESLSPGTSDMLARVTREAVNNMIRHGLGGRPCRITVRVSYRQVRVEFVNYVASPLTGEGLGLTGMRARVEAVGGQMVTVATEEDLWWLVVSVPL